MSIRSQSQGQDITGYQSRNMGLHASLGYLATAGFSVCETDTSHRLVKTKKSRGPETPYSKYRQCWTAMT